MADTNNTPRKFKLSWCIKNCFLLYVNNEESTSPKVLAENLDNSEWQVRLVPENSNGIILCYLNRLSKIKGGEKFYFDYESSFTNSEGDVVKSEKLINCVFKKGSLTIDMHQFSDKFQNLFLSFTIKSELPRLLAVGCEIETNISTKTCMFKWNVRHNYAAWMQIKKTFYIGSSRFEIELTKSEEFYTICIYCLDERSSETVEGKITVLNLEETSFGMCSAIHDFKNGVWKFPYPISINFLEGIVLKNDILILACEFTLSDYLESDEHVRYTFDSLSPVDNDFFVILNEDMQHLLSVSEHWDVLLQVEERNLPSHKHILAIQSPIFSAMFVQDMLDSQRGIVTIPNIDVKTMKLFLNFIYNERAEFVDYDSCVKLFHVANEYQVLALRDKCVNYLISVLAVNNVCKAIVVADIYKSGLLKENALSYLTENYEHIVIERVWSQWLERNKKFSDDILSKLAQKLSDASSYGEGKKMAEKFQGSQEALYKFFSSLLKNGANPNISSKYEFHGTLIGKVAGLGLEKITLLLLQSGARPTYYDLVASFKICDLAVIEALLQNGAPVSSSPKHCESALHRLSDIESREKTMQVCRLLVKYGADVDFENECYNTPLFFAVSCKDAEAIAALLRYGGQPCYQCPRGSPLERSFDLLPQIVQNLVKYAALYVKHEMDEEMYTFFQYFKQDSRDRDLLNGKPYLKFAQQCMAEINVLKKFDIDRNGNTLFEFAISQGATLKSFHDDFPLLQKVNEQMIKSKISIYREVIIYKLNRDELV